MKLCGFEVGLHQPLFLIAGPCVIESREFAIETAGQLKEIAERVGVPFIYKSSYDKANRSSTKTFRGFGMEEGLAVHQALEELIQLLDWVIQNHYSLQLQAVHAYLDTKTNQRQQRSGGDFPVSMVKAFQKRNSKKSDR